MSVRFTVRPLLPTDIDRAFPIAAILAPHLTLAQWRQFCRKAAPPADGAVPPRRGILSIESERGYIHGLCCYAVMPSLEHGATLAIEKLIALDIVAQAQAQDALMRAVERLAGALGCGAVEISERRVVGLVPKDRAASHPGRPPP